MLYVRELNAIYGIIKDVLLFYQKFVGDLMTIGFEMNPYDPCVANKTINGKQLTLVWHVNDIKRATLKQRCSSVCKNGSGKHTNVYSMTASAR